MTISPLVQAKGDADTEHQQRWPVFYGVSATLLPQRRRAF